jgi:hypothetical protein
MKNLSRGWSFLIQTKNLALADKDLIKASIYTLFVGLVVALIFIIPMASPATVLGN